MCVKKKISLYLHFYYDGEADEKTVDLWACAITETSAIREGLIAI